MAPGARVESVSPETKTFHLKNPRSKGNALQAEVADWYRNHGYEVEIARMKQRFAKGSSDFFGAFDGLAVKIDAGVPGASKGEVVLFQVTTATHRSSHDLTLKTAIERLGGIIHYDFWLHYPGSNKGAKPRRWKRLWWIGTGSGWLDGGFIEGRLS